MSNFMRRFANFQNSRSISYKLRANRMRLFEEYIQEFFGDEQQITILDLGGTCEFWKADHTTIKNRAIITIVNLALEKTAEPNFISIIGDARHLPQFKDKEYDIVFSNSVIEHVGDFEEQKLMANEIMRIGKYFFIQTPNCNFPIETHFLFPFFQFLPNKIKIFLMCHWSIGQYSKATSEEYAIQVINSVNLLSISQIKMLFNDPCIRYERILGLIKSIIAYKCSENS